MTTFVRNMRTYVILKDIKLYVFLNIINSVLTSLLGIYVIIFPRKIVDYVIIGDFNKAVETAILFLIFNVLTAAIKIIITYTVDNLKEYVKKHFDEKLKKKFMDLEYQKIETSSLLDEKERAKV
ncbi:hypothetical protein CG709_13900, partial [Lachnotalea glycerini]